MGSSTGALTVLLCLGAAVVWAGHILKQRKVEFINQGSLALMTGLGAGGAFYWYWAALQGSHIPAWLVAFNQDLYMELLLPPIIFWAGFSIKKKAFFNNFGTLVLLGIVGTFLNAALLALGASVALAAAGLDKHELLGNSLALGAVFSSTDSVAALGALNQESQPQLYALVFGEAVVNDATAIVLLRAVQHIRFEAQLSAETLAVMLVSFAQLFVLSLCLGVAVGLSAAFILQRSFAGQHSTDREISLLGALGFLSFIAAEQAGLSGVFASFFCGLTMSHYAWHSLSASAKVATIYTFRALAFVAEVAMFLACGLDMWSTSLWRKELYSRKSMVFRAATLATVISVLVPVVRALVLAPLLTAANRWRRPSSRITFHQGAALWWAGCARGAVSLALAVCHFNEGTAKAGQEASVDNKIICEACMVAVMLSTVVLGGVTPAVLRRLGVHPESGDRLDSEEVESPLTGAAVLAEKEEAGYQPLPAEALPVHAHANGAAARADSDTLGSLRSVNVHAAWSTLDRAYLQPFFGGRSASISAYRSPPPSPGRWHGAAGVFSDLRLAPPPPPPPQVAAAPPSRPTCILHSHHHAAGEADALTDALLPQGLPAESPAELRTVVEGLFVHPGDRPRPGEELVDQEMALGGMVEAAEAGTSVKGSNWFGSGRYGGSSRRGGTSRRANI